MGALPPFVYLVVALSSVVIAGGLLVWVVGYIRGAGRKGASSSGRQPSGSGPTSGGDQELLRVSRMGEDRLAVFVQGKRYRYLQEIKDPQVGRETVEALQAVLTFAEGWLPSLRPESPQIEAQRPAVEERVAPPRPRLSDLILPGRRDAPSPPEALVPVEQIDKLLQERLQEHSGLAERRIGLSTDASGDLRVYVDGDTFSSVDEVPEPEIQALIRKAIRTWEESYGGPGRSR